MLRQKLVKKLKKNGAIRSPAVEAAFLKVPRHVFVPQVHSRLAYRDQVIPTKRNAAQEAISSSSQPTIMAIMLEQLALQPGQRVLEIGAGTGYNAALMAHIVGAEGHITTLDIDEDIAQAARNHLAAARVDNVTVICADGVDGCAAHAPYDRIILTAAAGDIAPAWWGQLRPEGRIVLPLIISIASRQLAAAFVLNGHAAKGRYLESISVIPCGFMPLRGSFAPPQFTRIMPGQARAYVDHHGSGDPARWLQADFEAEAVAGLAVADLNEVVSGLRLNIYEAEALLVWLSLHEPERFLLLNTLDERLPRLFETSKHNFSSFGLLDDGGMVLLALPAHADGPKDDWKTPFAPVYRVYGEADRLIAAFERAVNLWEAAKRPSTQHMHIRVYKQETAPPPPPGMVISSRRWHDLLIGW